MSTDQKINSVLWLDDQIQYLSSTVAKISAGAFSISTTSNAVEAVRKIQASNFDIALVDVQLRANDFDSWYHFIESVRPLSSHTRFLIVTSHSELPGSAEQVPTDINMISKDNFVDDPIGFLEKLLQEGDGKHVQAAHSVEDYRDTIPADIPKLFSWSPAWELFNKLAKSTVLKLFSSLPIVILLYATFAKVPEIFAGSGNIPAIVPIILGYIFLFVAFVLTLLKCPPIVAENLSGARYQEKIYQSYLSDAQTRIEIDEASKNMSGKADHWRVRYYFNKANYSLPPLRTALLLATVVGIGLVMWPSLVNVQTIWVNEIEPWWGQLMGGEP